MAWFLLADTTAEDIAFWARLCALFIVPTVIYVANLGLKMAVLRTTVTHQGEAIRKNGEDIERVEAQLMGRSSSQERRRRRDNGEGK